jgi:hypothetical protein
VSGNDLWRLADLEGIRQLKSRYFRFLDTQNWGEWRPLFSDDLVSHRGGGADHFVDGVGAWLAGITTVHQGHTARLELTGPDTAAGVWPMFDYNENLAARPDRRGKQGFGHYHEEYRREADGWRIAATKITRIREDALVGPPLAQELGEHELAADWLPDVPRAAPDRLADREAIKQLKARWCRLLDTKSHNAWSDLFAREPPQPPDRGAVTVHHAHMPDIVFTGERSARAIWAINDYVDSEAGAFHRYGHHEEAYEKVGAEWQIAEHRASYRRNDPAVEPIARGDERPFTSSDWLAGAELPPLERLGEVEQLIELKSQVVDRLEAKDWGGLRALCTGSGEIELPAIADDAVVVHHAHTPEIRFTGPDTARGIWALFSYVERPGQPQRDGTRGYGHSEEGYRRNGDAWRLDSFRISWLRLDRLTGPPVPAYTGWSYQLPV